MSLVGVYKELDFEMVGDIGVFIDVDIGIGG